MIIFNVIYLSFFFELDDISLFNKGFLLGDEIFLIDPPFFRIELGDMHRGFVHQFEQ